jgi:two-component system chemotaxis sensor kinase CheA
MPNMNGFNLTKSIRAHPRLANIPVLIVTSRASAEDHQLGLDAGADGYIVKTSFDEAGLISAVSRLLGRTGERDSLQPTNGTHVTTNVGIHPAPSTVAR